MQSNNINSEALLQQLVTLATSLQSSIVSLDAKANEIKDYQKSADTKIDLIRDEVFKAEAYGTHSRKMHDGHVSDALNEESNPTDDVDAKHDVDNLVNKSDLTKPPTMCMLRIDAIVEPTRLFIDAAEDACNQLSNAFLRSLGRRIIIDIAVTGVDGQSRASDGAAERPLQARYDQRTTKYSHVAKQNNLRFIPVAFSHAAQTHAEFKALLESRFDTS